MSSKKVNNVVWSCVPLKKNSIEGFSNSNKTHTIDCGLPYIRASRNSDDSQIEIFNKMALEAREIQKSKPVFEAFKNYK